MAKIVSPIARVKATPSPTPHVGVLLEGQLGAIPEPGVRPVRPSDRRRDAIGIEEHGGVAVAKPGHGRVDGVDLGARRS